MMSSYEEILEVLDVLSEPKYDTSTRSKAESFNFLVTLMFMKNVMGETKCLTKEVQDIEINVIDTIESLDATITTLEHIRNNSDGLNSQILAAKTVADQNGIDPDYEFSKHDRVRKMPRRVDDRPETTVSLDLVDHNRKEFIAVLDAQINALRANKEAVTNVLQPALTLLKPPYHDPVDIGQLKQFCNMFPVSIRPDEDTLEAELTTFRCHLLENYREIVTVRNTLEYLKPHSKTLFPLTRQCFKLLLTVPVTSASAERSFSKLKLVKTVMRSVMNQERLRELLTLACERDLTDTIDIDKLADRSSKLTKQGRLIKI